MPQSAAGGITGCMLVAAVAVADPLSVPNASFESPATPFVSVLVNSWQKTPRPAWYVEGGGFQWTQLTGIFSNTPPGSFDHIANCHGNQAIWLFAVPEVGFFQDHDTVDHDDPAPSREFNAIYQPGNSYLLTVGVIGAGGGMLPGVPLRMGLYYLDALSNRVMVATNAVTNSALFAARTNLFDFKVRVPPVQETDAWAGRHIGIEFLSTVASNMQGGYWVLDNVRLETFPPPRMTALALEGADFRFTLLSEPGLAFEIIASNNLAAPSGDWPVRLAVTNFSGATNLAVTVTDWASGYFRARQVDPDPMP